ncbi:MAG: serine/threonine protein kinase [Gammaproteobacteria bacterium]|nr:serine/threonine protein kinase [Gammaproteobacteria bacterium]
MNDVDVNPSLEDEPDAPGDVDPPFAGLLPDTVLGAVEQLGWPADGTLLALNSYENRVYRLGLEDGPARVLKFYRPGRWSDEAILEEHAFTLALAAAEVPVVAPEVVGGTSLHEIDGYRYAVFPLRGGQWPDLDTREDRVRAGRLVGRLHAVARSGRFAHRPCLDLETFGDGPREYLLDYGWLPESVEPAYEAVSEQLLEAAEARIEAVMPATQRLHGDLHRSNLLAREELLLLVDFDDCMSGPAVQDLWMFVDGSPDEQAAQWEALLEGYETFVPFDRAELALVESLRALRMIHYAGWLARRWHDPAFPRAFPWFGESRYWEEHVLALKEQLGRVLGVE